MTGAATPNSPGAASDAAPPSAAMSGAASDAAAPNSPTERPQPAGGADVELLGLIDRLAELLHHSDLTELEVESGGTGLVLRKAVAMAAIAPGPDLPAPAPLDARPTTPGEPTTAGREPVTPSVPSIKAPLTGLFYASPAPGTAPYVQVGGEVAVGQVIGLIEAMKLFNEIKSDLAGRVVRVVPESGSLVKAKQPLIEVEPL